MNDRIKKLVIGSTALLILVSMISIVYSQGPFSRLVQRCQNRQQNGQQCRQCNQQFRQRTVTRTNQFVPKFDSTYFPTVISGPVVTQNASPFVDSPKVVKTSSQVSDRVFEVTASDNTKFRRAMAKALNASRKSDRISRTDAIKVRVAMFSPAFRDHVKKMCVVQMAFSENSEVLPRTDSGEIDVASIDWEGFASFLERIVPLIMELLTAFGVS